MQLSKVLKVPNWLKLFSFWLGRKVKALLIYIVKHPLGSIFWVVKAYLALMFLTLFVACSFGAFATDIPTLETKPAKKTLGFTCNAWFNDRTYGPYSGATLGECFEAGSTFLSTLIQLPPASATIVNGAQTVNITRSFESLNQTGTTSASVGYKVTEQSTTTTCGANAASNWQPVCTTSSPSIFTFTIGGVVNLLQQTEVYLCPPDGFPEYSEGPLANNTCSKPTPRPQPCWPDGGDWSTLPQFFFSDSSSDKICTFNDKGLNCPWKKSSKGVFVPDPQSPLDCDALPPEPPPPPPDCKVGGNGMKVCMADPNDRCTTIQEPNKVPVTTCDAKCGYVNGVFACFDHPLENPNDPSLPDKDPLKPVDDNITDPSKALSDMVKSDFKDILGGAEDRLDNLLTSAENSQKSNDALIGNLTAAQREGNRKLASIDENTKGIKENTKGILDALKSEGDISGGEKPEFTEPKNNWETRNFGTILKAKGDELIALPLFTSVRNFFNVSFGGNCPQYSVSVWVFDLSVDQFCNPTVNALWPYIRAVVLLVCSFFAIRIALL